VQFSHSRHESEHSNQVCTPFVQNYKSFWFFWYINFAIYLHMIYVYIQSKNLCTKKVKTAYNLIRGSTNQSIFCGCTAWFAPTSCELLPCYLRTKTSNVTMAGTRSTASPWDILISSGPWLKPALHSLLKGCPFFTSRHHARQIKVYR
jgi:hypothetical protein